MIFSPLRWASLIVATVLVTTSARAQDLTEYALIIPMAQATPLVLTVDDLTATFTPTEADGSLGDFPYDIGFGGFVGPAGAGLNFGGLSDTPNGIEIAFSEPVSRLVFEVMAGTGADLGDLRLDGLPFPPGGVYVPDGDSLVSLLLEPSALSAGTGVFALRKLSVEVATVPLPPVLPAFLAVLAATAVFRKRSPC